MSPVVTTSRKRPRSPSLSLRNSLLEHNFELQAFTYISLYSAHRTDQRLAMDTMIIDDAIQKFYQAYSKRLVVNGCSSWDKVVTIMYYDS
jgi:hypothetical protein